MIRKFLTAFAILIFSVVSASAGELLIGGGYMDGHSMAETRCTNPGINLDLGYDWTLGESDTSKFFGTALKAGGLFTYSNYDTAYREYAHMDMSDHRRDSSLTLSAMVTPSIRLGRVSLLGLAGVGQDWSQEDGFSPVFSYGLGLDLKLTERVSFGIVSRKTERKDTGNYEYTTGLIKIKF